MDANHNFNKLLSAIEHSKLNYMITRRTPFSGSVSLKSSFVKSFSNEFTEIQNIQRSNEENISEREKHLECETKEQKCKIKELESLIDEQKVEIAEERAKLEKMYETKKEDSNYFENQVASFREELLKVKREKHSLNTSMKKQTEALEKEAKDLKSDKEILQGMVEETKVAMDKKTRELDDQKKENCDITVLLDKSNSDLVKFKLKKQTEVQSVYECSECNFRFPSHKVLKEHIRSDHCRNSATQHDEIRLFEEYPCYYCDEIIWADNDLEKHYGCIRPMEEVKYPCNFCETSCISISELEHHMKVYHYEWDLPDEPIFRFEFPCDVCDTNCKSKDALEQHTTAYHSNFFTEANLKSCDFLRY